MLLGAGVVLVIDYYVITIPTWASATCLMVMYVWNNTNTYTA